MEFPRTETTELRHSVECGDQYLNFFNREEAEIMAEALRLRLIDWDYVFRAQWREWNSVREIAKERLARYKAEHPLMAVPVDRGNGPGED